MWPSCPIFSDHREPSWQETQAENHRLFMSYFSNFFVEVTSQCLVVLSNNASGHFRDLDVSRHQPHAVASPYYLSRAVVYYLAWFPLPSHVYVKFELACARVVALHPRSVCVWTAHRRGHLTQWVEISAGCVEKHWQDCNKERHSRLFRG